MAGSSLCVVAEGGLKIGVIGQILLLVEIIRRSVLRGAVKNIVARAGVDVRAEGLDQVLVAGNVL